MCIQIYTITCACMHVYILLAPCCTSGVSSGLLVDEIWIPITEEVVVTQQLGYHYSNGFGASYTHTSSCSNHCQNFLPWPQHAVMQYHACMHACSMHDRGRHGTDKKKWSGTKALKDTQCIPQSFMHAYARMHALHAVRCAGYIRQPLVSAWQEFGQSQRWEKNHCKVSGVHI